MSVTGLDLLRQAHQTSNATAGAMKTTPPPTTPPAIAPAFVLLGLCGDVEDAGIFRGVVLVVTVERIVLDSTVKLAPSSTIDWGLEYVVINVGTAAGSTTPYSNTRYPSSDWQQVVFEGPMQ